MKRFLLALVVLALAGGAVFWFLTSPKTVEAAAISGMTGDAKAGERIFWLGGCASCHAVKGAKAEEKLKLGGGQAFATDFGTFYAPNISPDPKVGIGAWSALDLVNAMQRGVSPDGRHYYPAFPYTSYIRMEPKEIVDLAAFLKTLPPVDTASKPHDVGFPFSIRRGLGLWKLLYLSPAPIAKLPADASPEAKAGQHIVEGAGHCGECHTPRNSIGGTNTARWLAGAKALEGDGRTPNITPDEKALGGWSASDISYYLESGFTPDGDSVGGPMVSVVDNLSHAPKPDRDAIAAYLKAIPALPKE